MADHCRLKADAVIFDKDGTLIDFDAFWVPVSDAAVKDILVQVNQDQALADEILEAFGIHNGITDVNGVLCKGTYGQMAQIVHDILMRHGCAVPEEETKSMIIDTYRRNFHAGQIKPTCPNLRAVLSALKNQNKKLAVVTTDTSEITLFCLEGLGIADLFDRIYTDDGTLPTKPHPACALDFCARSGSNKAHTVMVGDTGTDLAFARNAGIKMVGVAKTDANRQLFCETADATICDISQLLEILE